MNDDFVDLYATIGIDRSAKSSAIRKAYLLKARDLHPDKNPDDPTAPARFVELKRASETLLDDAKRAEFDKQYDARAANEARNADMNAARKRMRADLEAAEAAAAAASRFTAPSEAEVAPKAHLDAMRQRNAQFCAHVSEQAAQQRSNAASAAATGAEHTSAEPQAAGGAAASAPAPSRVRLRWAADTGRAAFALNSADALPTEAALMRLMARFGQVTKASARRPGEAVVTFAGADAAARAAVSAPAGFKVSMLKESRSSSGSRSAGSSTAASTVGKRQQAGPLLSRLKLLQADDALKAQVRDSLRALRELLRRAHVHERQPPAV